MYAVNILNQLFNWKLTVQDSIEMSSFSNWTKLGLHIWIGQYKLLHEGRTILYISLQSLKLSVIILSTIYVCPSDSLFLVIINLCLFNVSWQNIRCEVVIIIKLL